jgi:DNA-binding HxlR family transcriptional regulator
MSDGYTHVPGDCRQLAPILQRVGDKWSILCVMALGEGALRFNELKRRVGGISQRMLTLTVRSLERDGFVTRTMLPTVPPAVSYELTPMGRSLLEPVRALGNWAFSHQAAIQAARQRFDQHGPGTGLSPTLPHVGADS